MSITYKIAELLDLLVLHSSNPPYWVEIKTKNSTCTYYFRHFNHPLAAKLMGRPRVGERRKGMRPMLMQRGYIQDLIDENAVVTSVKIQRCQPKQLTVIEAEEKL